MRPYKNLTIICGTLSILSFLGCLVLHYWFDCAEADFWVNVCLAIFGSALLSALAALVPYFHEKRTTLEGFMYQCRQILHTLNKYQITMPLEEKMKFFLDYHDLDKSAWDAAFGNMDFFFERITGHRKYIFQKIYTPIVQFNEAVNQHVWHFRWYFDGSGKNAPVMEMFVGQLECHLIYQDEQSIPTDYDKFGHPTAFREVTSVESKLVHEVSQELNGKYYDLMYGKRKTSKRKHTKQK